MAKKNGLNIDSGFPLRKHAFSNKLKILPPKNENFQVKKSDMFS